MKITIKEIAKKSGFGVGTVSRAFNPSSEHSIKEETREKILAVARHYDYVRNASAKVLVTGRSQDLGLVIPAVFESLFYNDFFIKLIAGATQIAYINGYNVRLMLIRPEVAYSEFIREVKSHKLAGIVMSSYCGDFLIEKENILKLKAPVVLLGRHMNAQGIRSISLDDFGAGYDGASFLIGLGHRRIAVMRINKDDVDERYKGHMQAMQDSGLAVNQSYILMGDGKEITGYQEAMKILNRKNRPTAIFCLNDEMAIGAMRAARDKGIRCPEEFSVLGCDGMDIGEFTSPSLTTMSRPVYEMGEMAVKILLKKHDVPETPRVRVRAELIRRESCKER